MKRAVLLPAALVCIAVLSIAGFAQSVPGSKNPLDIIRNAINELQGNVTELQAKANSLQSHVNTINAELDSIDGGALPAPFAYDMFLKIEVSYRMNIERILAPIFSEYIHYITAKHRCLRKGKDAIIVNVNCS